MLSSPMLHVCCKPGVSRLDFSAPFLPNIETKVLWKLGGSRLSRAAPYLLVLVGCDSGEHCLRKVEGFHSIPYGHRLGGWEIAAEVFADHMDSRLVFVHRVQNDLKRGEGRLWEVWLRVSCIFSNSCAKYITRWKHWRRRRRRRRTD